MDLIVGEKRLSSGRVLKREWKLAKNSQILWKEIQTAKTFEVQVALYCEGLRKRCAAEYWQRIKEFENDIIGYIEDGWRLQWMIN